MPQFLETGQVLPPQVTSALQPSYPVAPIPQRVPPPLNYFTQRGQQLTTAGPQPTPVAPPGFFSRALPPGMFAQPELPPKTPTDFSYFIPGQVPGGPGMAAPDTSDLAARIAALKGPTAPGETDKWTRLAQAAGGAQWESGVATGTNLFNVGMAMLGGVARSDIEEKKAQEDYQEALRAFELQKMQLESGLSQQDFENQLKTQEAQRKAQPVLKPTIKDGMLIYGQPEEGGQRITTKKIAPTKQEQALALSQQLSKGQTADVAGALTSGKVPAEMSQMLIPKLMEAQQAVMAQYGAQIMQMPENSQRAYINMLTNTYLRNDPEVGPLVQTLGTELQAQSALASSLK